MMIFSRIIHKISSIKSESEEIKILCFYRYLSLFITSLFYVYDDLPHSTLKKIFIIFCISMSAVLFTYLYIENEKSTSIIKKLVLIETIGILFILIVSGGLNSPYIWYTLNTLIITSVQLNYKYSWFNFLIYFITSIGTSYYMFNHEKGNLLNFLQEESHLILSFILITIAIQQISQLIKYLQKERDKLSKINMQLEEANEKIKESMHQTFKLYYIVHSLNQKNPNNLIELIVECMYNNTKTQIALYQDISQEEKKTIIKGGHDLGKLFIERLKDELLRNLGKILHTEIPIEISVENKRFLLAPVRSTYMIYGVLVIENTASAEDVVYKENLDQFRLLVELSSIVIEKLYLEEVKNRLIITEEQNRIANEIHDSALQRLFSISCGIFALMKKVESFTSKEIREELNVIRSTINHSMQELRSSIYGFSWKKEGVNTFEVDIIKFINETKKLHEVEILFHMTGNHEFLSTKQKKVLFRIICEGIANAIRHGKAKHINVSVDIKEDVMILVIHDNGVGFHIDNMTKEKTMGLGIKNINYLAYSINGKVNFESEIGNGTTIKVTILNRIQEKEEAI